MKDGLEREVRRRVSVNEHETRVMGERQRGREGRLMLVTGSAMDSLEPTQGIEEAILDCEPRAQRRVVRKLESSEAAIGEHVP